MPRLTSRATFLDTSRQQQGITQTALAQLANTRLEKSTLEKIVDARHAAYDNHLREQPNGGQVAQPTVIHNGLKFQVNR